LRDPRHRRGITSRQPLAVSFHEAGKPLLAEAPHERLDGARWRSGARGLRRIRAKWFQIFAHGRERRGHDRLQVILPEALDEAPGDGAFLERIDGAVQAIDFAGTDAPPPAAAPPGRRQVALERARGNRAVKLIDVADENYLPKN
jgi:hypothetical protein